MSSGHGNTRDLYGSRLNAEEIYFEKSLDGCRTVDGDEGPLHRRLSSWIWRATSSFPLPDRTLVATLVEACDSSSICRPTKLDPVGVRNSADEVAGPS
jgi:hypothetical protein